MSNAAPLTSAAACPTCQGPARYAFTTLSQPVFRCVDDGCGLAFDHPQPTDAQLEAAYAEDYAPDKAAGCTPAGVVDVKLDALERRLGPLRGRHVLDFGAGTGTIATGLVARGALVAAVETAPRGRAEIAERLGIPVAATLDDLRSVDPAPFDVVMMVEVIEHVRDPRASLEAIRAVMQPGAAIFVTTPNLGSLQYRLRGAKWSQVASPVHIMYFDRGSLEATLRAAGFDRIEGVPEAGEHPGRSRPRRAMQVGLRRFGLGGGLQVIARVADRDQDVGRAASNPPHARTGSTG